VCATEKQAARRRKKHPSTPSSQGHPARAVGGVGEGAITSGGDTRGKAVV